MKQESYFDGGLLSYVEHSILAGLITILILGICAPWGACVMINWKVKHTVIDGHRLVSDGTATQLFGNWIRRLILAIITISIYLFWLNIKLQQWITRHTHYLDQVRETCKKTELH